MTESTASLIESLCPGKQTTKAVKRKIPFMVQSRPSTSTFITHEPEPIYFCCCVIFFLHLRPKTMLLHIYSSRAKIHDYTSNKRQKYIQEGDAYETEFLNNKRVWEEEEYLFR
ncbi:CLUMA_CG009061, isoform A [Clunio marinus]|uniref:CLUMA_CG009061, isoform A n=1 Tax=Clunio marinus TaxID=568069 RepID=A0A1J1I777_9DIPT|nr:CLUMA_CG009061, isoform A [Clunio marinus]